MMANNSFSVPSSEIALVSTFFLKDIFAGYGILGCQSFSFSPVTFLFHFCLSSIISDEKLMLV